MTEETQEQLRNVKDCEWVKAKENVKMIEGLFTDKYNVHLSEEFHKH